MLREEGIEEIYDGRFYSPDDLVPVGCSGCEGCSDCCRNTGDTIILDPYDMYLLQTGTGRTFEEMIELQIEIRLVEGLILPNLMQHHEGESGGNNGLQETGFIISFRKMTAQEEKRRRSCSETGWGSRTCPGMKPLSAVGTASGKGRKTPSPS